MTQAVLLALLPLLCCFVRCALDGETISSVWLPGGFWNTELFFYKQVEGIVHYGYPQGYFGYNESQALQLSFGAQSPVLLFPWVIWGLVFGWELWSPVICNIVLTSLVCFLFVCMVKPTWKQLGILALLFSLYAPFTRYMLSAMAEVLCFDMLILFYALAVNYLDRKKNYKLVLLFVMAVLMTLMQPCFALTLLLPAYLWTHRLGWRGAAGSAAVAGAAIGGGVCISHYLQAAYFAQSGFADWLRVFEEQGVSAGLRSCITRLHYMGRGTFFCGCILILCILIGQSLLDRRRFRALGRASEDSVVWDEENAGARKRLYNRLVIQMHLAFSLMAMLFAAVLLRGTEEGGRDLLPFMAAGIFVIALMDTEYFVKVILLGLSFVWLYFYRADPGFYELPYRQEEREAQFAEWEEAFDLGMELKREADVPGSDNSVIWVLQEEAADGSPESTEWQLLYALPEGFGISCCTREYVLANFEELKSRYIAVLPGGRIDEMCRDAGYREIGRDGELVVYRRR